MTGILTRRRALAAGTAAVAMPFVRPSYASAPTSEPGALTVWARSDSHIPADLACGRESLREAIKDVERTPGLPRYDLAIDLGDWDASQSGPNNIHGEQCRAQRVYDDHIIEDEYCLPGNHDLTPYADSAHSWFRQWIDPLGEYTAISGVNAFNFKYEREGDHLFQEIRIGNLRFLLIGKDARPATHLRGTAGGDPGGVVSPETYLKWLETVARYYSGPEVVIGATHESVYNTVAYSGLNERYVPGHGCGRECEAPSFFSYFGERRFNDLFAGPMAKWFGLEAIHISGHSHHYPTANDGKGKGTQETKFGTFFNNISALTSCHGPPAPPRSTLFTFYHNSDVVRRQVIIHKTGFGYRRGPLRARALRLPKVVTL